MKKTPLFFLISFLFPSYATTQIWQNECIGYYQLSLPDNLEVALYPLDLIINPRKDPSWEKNTFSQRYLFPKISFGEDRYQNNKDSVQAQFSAFYYGNYDIVVSSENESTIDLLNYERQFKERTETHVQDYWDVRNYELTLKLPVLSEYDAKKSLAYSIDNYKNSFSATDSGGYSLFIKDDNRLYIFKKSNEAQSLDKQLKTSKPEIVSLLKRFQPRKLYEVPAEQGFCLPYGFIARDSGHEPRNMGVTYRLKNHPDVSIFFQDFGPNPGPGERRPDPNMSAKDYVTYFWNTRYGHSFREIKLYGEGVSYPEIDKRNAVAAFAKFTRFSKEIDYGYVAFVKGTTPDEPDLLFYVMRDSRQAADNSPMDKDELKKMAEHIVSTIKRR